MTYNKFSNRKLRQILIDMKFKSTRHQMKAVRILYNQTMTKTELAKKLKVERTTVYYMLMKFEENGMLEKNPNLDDLRGDLLGLSEDFIKKLTHTPIMHYH